MNLSQKHGVLLCSDLKEPVTQSLVRYQDGLSFQLVVLTLEDILNDVEIFDEVIEGIPKIGWSLQDGNCIINSHECLLINRVFSVPGSLFENFHPADRNYALAEFRAYLMFAIEAFPLSTSKPGSGGLSGNQFSLPQQWKIVQDAKVNVDTPSYYLGNPLHQPFKNTNVIIQSTIFNYYYWRPGIPSCKEMDINFCFLRPEGIPVICLVIGTQCNVFPYSGDYTLSESVVLKLTEIGKCLARIFDYFIAECLFFLNEEQITFGMISNIPYASRKKDFFVSALLSTCNSMISPEVFCVS